MSQKNLWLALSLTLTLGVTGCASLKSKPTASVDSASSTETNTDAANAAATNNSAETSGLNGKEGLNSSGLGDANSANGQNDANNGSNNSSANANGEVSLADLLTIRLVHFDYDSSDLSNADYKTLQAHAQYLSQSPNAKILLKGHADERGTREYNMALGERRANAVQAFLNSNGVKSTQIDTVSYGKEDPVNENHDEAAWAENRRVEINYTTGAPK